MVIVYFCIFDYIQIFAIAPIGFSRIVQKQNLIVEA